MVRYSIPRKLLVTLLAITALFAVACGGGETGGTHSAPPAQSETPPVTNETPPAAAPVTLGSSGVTGKASYDGAVPKLKPISMNADPGCASKHDSPVPPQTLVLGNGNSLGNVFVQVKNAPAGTFAPPAEAAVIDQKGCIYEPHVLGVLAGQKLIFRNSDGVLHNVHGLPKENREFNMGMPPTVTEAEAVLNRPEPVFPVKCDVHPWMRSYVAVMSHPFFAVTNADGSFVIEGLPAGTYELEAWHEKLGTQTASVTVADGETGAAEFTFSAPS